MTPRSRRKVFKRATKGVKVHLPKRKPGKAKCAGCGKVLAGVPRERPHRMQGTAKTKKRPQRLYGGQLCSRCSRKKIIESIRQ